MAVTCSFTGPSRAKEGEAAGQYLVVCVRGGLHSNPNVCWPASSHLGTGHERGPDRWISVDHHRVWRCWR